MADKEFAEFVQALEVREARSECLVDEQLAALASDAIHDTDDLAWRSHLTSCLSCLQAYASLHAALALSDESATERRAWYETARALLSRVGREVISRIRHAMGVPVPLAWSALAIVATTLLTHGGVLHLSWTRPQSAPTSPSHAMPTATERNILAGKAGDIRTAGTPEPTTTSVSSPCGSRRWRIESVVTRNLISHLFVCGDGGADDVVYVISGRPTQVTQGPDQTAAILEQARIQRLE